MIGALLATFIYQKFGFIPVALTAILFNVFALLALGELTQRLTLLPRIFAWFRRVEGKET
jgi:hypothetical protein